MNRDDAMAPTGEPDEHEHRVPAGTWASEPGEAEALADGEPSGDRPGIGPGDDPSESAERPARPHAADVSDDHERRSPSPRREVTTRSRVGERAKSGPGSDVSDSQIRPRFLASELLRRRAESQEPIWPRTSRVLGALGGSTAAALAVALVAPGPLGVAVAVAASLMAVAAVISASTAKRSIALALTGAVVFGLGAALIGLLPETLVCGAALLGSSGGFLRARRFGSRAPRALFLLAAALGCAAFILGGGVGVMSITTFDLGDVLPSVGQLFLLAAVLGPLATLVDTHGPSGARVIAAFWLLERVAAAAFHIELDGLGPRSVGSLVVALVLPATALAMAQVLSTQPRARRALDHAAAR